MEILVHRAEFVPGASVPLFELRPPVFDGFDYFVKRCFDFVGALLLIVALSPLLLAIAIAVFFTSRGGILYRSIRPGIGGEPFACFKFRTMRSDADQVQADSSRSTRPRARCSRSAATAHDARRPRATRLLARRAAAAVQRRARQMSLVARARCRSATSTSSRSGTRSATRAAGLTGLWQVSGRSELDFDDLVRLDFLYLERWSVGLDSRSCSRRSRRC